MLFTNLIQTNLQTSFVGRNIEYFSFTESTNDDAFEFINDNEAEDGMLIITDNQTNGRGRRNNKWHSSPGSNLTFSLILKKTNDLIKSQPR
jgi:Biotin-(acetyl-CoA carboxylase) ligase